MEIHEQLKRQLKEYKWKDYTKVSVEIAPEYDDFFEKAGDDYIKSIDMIRFATDTVYSKTHFACLDNELDYDEQHYENIKRIDNFVNKKGIIDVLDACGNATSSSYKFHEELEEWLYLVWFPNKELVALIDDETIQIKRTKRIK